MTEVGLDVRFALRSFRRTPGFTVVALLTLALGIGATTAVFSVVNAAMGRTLPFPEADESLIDESLSALVAATIRLVSLGRSARKESRLKVRQPLAELIVVPGNEVEREAVELFRDHFLEELNVKSLSRRDDAEDLVEVIIEPNMKTLGPKFGRNAAAVRAALEQLDGREVEWKMQAGKPLTITLDDGPLGIDTEDLSLRKTYAEHLAGASDGPTVVMIDKRLTPELKMEGHARDIIRNVQKLRKEAGLDIADRITLSLATDAEPLRAAIDHCADYIQHETLAVAREAGPTFEPLAQSEMKIDGMGITIALVRA